MAEKATSGKKKQDQKNKLQRNQGGFKAGASGESTGDKKLGL